MRRCGLLLPLVVGIAACVPIGQAKRDRPGGSDEPAAVPGAQSTQSSRGEASPVAKVLVNQVGYYTNLAKIATVRSDAKRPLDWKLYAGDGHEVATGEERLDDNLRRRAVRG